RPPPGPRASAPPASAPTSLSSTRLDPATPGLPPAAAPTATDSVGGATAVAAHLPTGAAHALTAAAHSAFTDAIGLALLIGTGVLLTAAVIVRRYLPDVRIPPVQHAASDSRALQAERAAA